jgi:thiol-disulfide isomerase/thioredoxin
MLKAVRRSKQSSLSVNIAIIFVGLLILQPVTGSQGKSTLQDDENARSLLVKVASTYANLRQFYFETLETTETLSKGFKRSSQVRYVTAADTEGRARFSASSAVNSDLAVFDGSIHWNVAPFLRQYTRQNADSPTFTDDAHTDPRVLDARKAALRYKKRYAAVATRLLNARFINDEKSKRQVSVEASYSMPAGMPKGKIFRRYWIDTKFRLVTRELSIASIANSNTEYPTRVEQVIAFSSTAIGNDIPAEAFVFTPPSGAELVEQFGVTSNSVSRLENRRAPQFELQGFDGTTYRSQELIGKVVLLDFWATWCKPCRIDLPHIDALSQEFSSQGLVVLGMNTEPRDRSQTFFEHQGYSFPSLVDLDATVSRRYLVRSIPTLVVIDREGKISSYLVGLYPEERLRSELSKVGIR